MTLSRNCVELAGKFQAAVQPVGTAQSKNTAQRRVVVCLLCTIAKVVNCLHVVFICGMCEHGMGKFLLVS